MLFKIIFTAAIIAASFCAKAQCRCIEETPIETWRHFKNDTIETLYEPTGDKFVYTLVKDQLLIEGDPITVDSITTEEDKKTIIYGEYYKMKLTIYYNMYGQYEGHKFENLK